MLSAWNALWIRNMIPICSLCVMHTNYWNTNMEYTSTLSWFDRMHVHGFNNSKKDFPSKQYLGKTNCKMAKVTNVFQMTRTSYQSSVSLKLMLVVNSRSSLLKSFWTFESWSHSWLRYPNGKQAFGTFCWADVHIRFQILGSRIPTLTTRTTSIGLLDLGKAEDFKVLIRSGKSKKGRQYNNQKKRTNNDLQNTTQKTIDWTIRTSQEMWNFSNPQKSRFRILHHTII